jgi:3-oxoacyl-[acyl-carrier-protein] synthase III
MSQQPGRPIVEIADIAYHLPDRVVTNDDLGEIHPDWDMDRVGSRAGVLSRHVAADGETALDLGAAASHALIDRHPGLADQLDGLIFCTQTPDYVMPPNACVLHERLGLGEDVLALDTNLACSGFVYALAMAEGLIATGSCSNVLVVTADTYSRLINPGDRAAGTLFGDAAAATWVRSSSTEGRGLLDVQCATSGVGYEKFYVPAGGFRTPRSAATATEETDRNGNVRTAQDIHMDGLGVLSFVTSKVPNQVRVVLDRNSTTPDDLDLVVFHQASKMALDTLTRSLKVRPDRVFRNLESIGNTVSASIPISLAQAAVDGRTPEGALVLLSSFGVGLSWATALVRF